jgi:hypothetical protein
MAQIVTCKNCGFQTTWTSAVDWDDEFECRNCSGTKFGKFTKKDFQILGTVTGRVSCGKPNFIEVDKGNEKKELLDRIRQFLWNTEHTNIIDYKSKTSDDLEDIVCEAHELRIEIDKVFGNENN